MLRNASPRLIIGRFFITNHERCVDLNDGSPNFELPMDTGLKWDRSMVDSFPGSDLECVGLCDSIVYLVCS